MVKVDFIIVGCGLAGIAFCEVLKANNNSFIVYDNESQQSSIVAAGLYNPVILKRFTAVWKAQEQLKKSIPVYNTIEKNLDVTLDYKPTIYRRFNSIEEQNLWFSAVDKPNLEPFLSPIIKQNTYKYVDAIFGLGKVLQTGRVDTKQLIATYKSSLAKDCLIKSETFQHSELKLENNSISYSGIEAKYILFAEGFGVKQNPFFNNLPLNGTKGEVLTIKAPSLKLNEAIKSSVFIIPIGNNLYRVGATYNRFDKTNSPSDEAKEELITKLKRFITCDFEIIAHHAGMRPTVKDRRPLVGKHYKHNNIYMLNGLGSRGVMVAPYVAEKLYNFIENKMPLDTEIDLNRFEY